MSETESQPSSSDPSPSDTSAPENALQDDQNLDIENLTDTYQIVGEWIRFADAKAAVVLTVAGALAGFMVPTLRPFMNPESMAPESGVTFSTIHVMWSKYITVGLFFLWLILLGQSCIWAFLCVTPFRRKGRHPAINQCTHFHSAAIASKYRIDETEQFTKDFKNMTETDFRKEILVALLIDSHIANAKYVRVSRAIRLLGLSSVFGLFYALAIQF